MLRYPAAAVELRKRAVGLLSWGRKSSFNMAHDHMLSAPGQGIQLSKHVIVRHVERYLGPRHSIVAAGLPPPQFTKLPPGGGRSERLESLQRAVAQVRPMPSSASQTLLI